MNAGGLKNLLRKLPQKLLRKPIKPELTSFSPLCEGVKNSKSDLFEHTGSIPLNSTIGRDHIFHPHLQADRSVSRKHAQLNKRGILTDLGSTAGTHVNGARIQDATPLKINDVVRFGQGDCYYHFDGKQLLPRQTITLGRQTESHLQAHGIDPWVSKEHFTLTPDGFITDLSTRTGTFVDGERIHGTHQLQNGSIIKLGLGLSNYYFSNGKLIPLTPEKAELLLKLFPKGLARSEFKQGQYGNCTFLASLKSMLKNNPAQIIEKIEPLPNNRVKLSFLDAHHPQIEMELDDYKHSGVQGPIGVRLMETAFARSLKPSPLINSVEILNQGGLAYEALKGLHNGKDPCTFYNAGRPLKQQSKKNIEHLMFHLKKIERDPANHIAVTATGINRPELWLIANHAYSLLQVDSKNKLVTLANPHDSKKFMQLRFDDYLTHFRSLIVTQP